MTEHQQTQKDNRRKAPQATPRPPEQEELLAHTVDPPGNQQTLLDPRLMTPPRIRYLQRTIGNAATQRLLAEQSGDEPVSPQPTASFVESILQRKPPEEEDKENNTGLPDTLKSGVEYLSGLSLDEVKVHYNSVKPAQVQAHAYTRGTDIHVAPGQERHLPHEAWHVVQQAQGRVRPTLQTKGVASNDEEGLEHEADVMGARAALQRAPESGVSGPIVTRVSLGAPPVIQRAPLKWRELKNNLEQFKKRGAEGIVAEVVGKLREYNPAKNEVESELRKEVEYLDELDTVTQRAMDEADIFKSKGLHMVGLHMVLGKLLEQTAHRRTELKRWLGEEEEQKGEEEEEEQKEEKEPETRTTFATIPAGSMLLTVNPALLGRWAVTDWFKVSWKDMTHAAIWDGAQVWESMSGGISQQPPAEASARDAPMFYLDPSSVGLTAGTIKRVLSYVGHQQELNTKWYQYSLSEAKKSKEKKIPAGVQFTFGHIPRLPALERIGTGRATYCAQFAADVYVVAAWLESITTNRWGPAMEFAMFENPGIDSLVAASPQEDDWHPAQWPQQARRRWYQRGR